MFQFDTKVLVIFMTATPPPPDDQGRERAWQLLIATSAAVLGVVIGTPLLGALGVAA